MVLGANVPDTECPGVKHNEGGPVVGLLPEASYRTASVALNPGDVLILCTDGVIEAENDKEEMFSVLPQFWPSVSMEQAG